MFNLDGRAPGLSGGESTLNEEAEKTDEHDEDDTKHNHDTCFPGRPALALLGNLTHG